MPMVSVQAGMALKFGRHQCDGINRLASHLFYLFHFCFLDTSVQTPLVSHLACTLCSSSSLSVLLCFVVMPSRDTAPLHRHMLAALNESTMAKESKASRGIILCLFIKTLQTVMCVRRLLLLWKQDQFIKTYETYMAS